MRLGALVGVGLRGLRARALITAGSVLLATIAVAAAVVGPMYQDGAARSYLVTALREQPNYNTGMTFDYTPTPGQDLHDAEASAERKANALLPKGFTPPHAFVWSETTWAPALGPQGGQPTLAAATGACRHVALTGACPTKPNQVAMLEQDAAFLHLQVGQSFRPWQDKRVLTLTGIYAPRQSKSDLDFWFESIRLESIPADNTVNSPPTPINPHGGRPYRPAPFITPVSTFTKTRTVPLFIKLDKRVAISPTTSVADLGADADVARAVLRDRNNFIAIGPGSTRVEVGNALPAIAHQVALRRATAKSTVSPAVISVILVALVLLLRLLSAAMDLRRTELALAALRGSSRRRMWVLGLIEPLLMVAIALPIGVVSGIVAARALARIWLIDGLPMPVVSSSLVGVLVVVMVTLVVAAVVVRDAVSEPLSSQIAGIRRPTRATRLALILRLVLIAVAVAVLGATLARSGQRAPDAADLLLPILLATAAGLVTSLGAQVFARAWARASNRRRGLFAYVASRTISRRREGTLVILPLTAALAVSIFATGVYTSAAAWRASDAATIVGADESYLTNLPLGQAVALTHRLDPQGKWLMATAANYVNGGTRMIVDAPRLPRVATWPGTWTSGVPVSTVAGNLAPKRPSVVLTGARLSMTVDNRVVGDSSRLGIEVQFIDDLGNVSDVVEGPFARGTSTHAVALPDCQRGCLVENMSFGGPAALNESMRGVAVVSRMAVDDKPVPAALTLPWLAPAASVGTPNAVTGRPTVTDGRLTVRFDAKSANNFANIAPTDVPKAIPVYWGRTYATPRARAPGAISRITTGSVSTFAVRSAGTTESMPVLGPAGVLIDYTMFTRSATLATGLTIVRILARSDTPQSIISGLAANGISRPETLASARSVLDQDAFALALKLYLVVTAIVILLALAGLGANLAVQMPARRRDSASMRVVGMRRRSVMAAVVAEFFVVLGAAAVAGVAAGSLSQYVVVRTVTLGYADTEHTPRLIATFNLTSALQLLAGLAVALFLVGVTVAGLTVRGARTASLREDAR